MSLRVSSLAAVVGGILAGTVGAPAWSAEATAAVVSSGDLRLLDLRRWVLQRNESVQMRMLDVEIGKKTYEAEKGIFEPQVVASLDRVDTQRPNNTQQLANLGLLSTPVFYERNTLYSAGLEFLSPIGTRLQTGYVLRELGNNLQQGRGPEYENFIGATVTQPLLRNAGTTVTLAKIRLAALASESAFQEYRRQLMLTMAQAESAYWDLYLAQERVRIGAESLVVGEKILEDNRARLEVGKSSELEVLQAEAGVAFRKTRLNDASQRVFEAGNRLGALYGRSPTELVEPLRATDRPAVIEDSQSFSDAVQEAFVWNPDFLLRRTQAEQEGIRVEYTRNQRLPQLNLKGSYGLNGLGLSAGDAWDDIDSHNYAAWSLGLEFRMPITGGVKERREYEAAQLARERAMVGLKEVETQVFNGIDSSRRRLALYAEDVVNYSSVADFQARLLQAQLDRLAVGSVESRVVLETEEKLSEARVAVVESQVSYQRSLLELELVRGTLLNARDFEVSREQLTARTRAHLRMAQLPAQDVRALQQKAEAELDRYLKGGRNP